VCVCVCVCVCHWIVQSIYSFKCILFQSACL